MRRLLNLLLAAALLIIPSVSVASASAPKRSAAKKTSVKKPSGKVSKGKTSPAPKVNVKAYTKKNGTVVAAHQRTAPNSTKKDNWSTKGNVNPNTGKAGTKPADKTKQ